MAQPEFSSGVDFGGVWEGGGYGSVSLQQMASNWSIRFVINETKIFIKWVLQVLRKKYFKTALQGAQIRSWPQPFLS